MSELFGHLQLSDFFSMAHETYPAVTLEILSSFEKLESARGVSGFSFRFRNEERVWDVSKLCRTFRLPRTGETYIPNQQAAFDLWYKITGSEEVDTRHLLLSQVQHPCLRLLLKLFGTSLFGRADNSTCRVNELAFLATALLPEPQECQHQNLAHAAIHHWDSVAHSTSTTPIWLGGICTFLATQHGFRDNRPPSPSSLLNKTFLVRSGYLGTQDDHWSWKFFIPDSADPFFLTLPSNDLPPLERGRDHYLLPPPRDDSEEEGDGIAGDDDGNAGEGDNIEGGHEERRGFEGDLGAGPSHQAEIPHVPSPAHYPSQDPSVQPLPSQDYLDARFSQLMAGQQQLMASQQQLMASQQQLLTGQQQLLERMNSMSVSFRDQMEDVNYRLDEVDVTQFGILQDTHTLQRDIDAIWDRLFPPPPPPHAGPPSHWGDGGAGPSDAESSPHPGNWF